MSERATPYEPSDLVRQLHGLPHYDFSYQRVDSTFAPDNMRYIESLVNFATPFFLGAIISVLALLCCRRCRRRGGYDIDDEKERRATTVLTAMAVTSLVISSIFFIGNEEVSKGVGSFLNSIDSVQAFFDDFFSSVDNLGKSIDNSMVVLSETKIDGAENELKSMNDTLAEAYQFTEDIASRSDSLGVSAFNDAVNTGNDDRWLGFTIFGAMLVVAATGTCLIRRNTGGPKCCVIVVNALMSFLGFCAAGICMVIAVGVADFCDAPNESILSLVGAQGSNTSSAQVARFYIDCPVGQSNPMTGDIKNASTKVNESIIILQDIENQGVGNTTRLQSALADTQNASNIMTETTGCETINGAYVQAVSSLCDPTLTGLFLILAVAAMVALLLIVANATTLRRPPPYKQLYSRLDRPTFYTDDRKYRNSDPLVDKDFYDPGRSPDYGSTSSRRTTKVRQTTLHG